MPQTSISRSSSPRAVAVFFTRHKFALTVHLFHGAKVRHLLPLLCLIVACDALPFLNQGTRETEAAQEQEPEVEVRSVPDPIVVEEVEEEPELRRPMALWRDGHEVETVEGETARNNGYLPLDLGDHWTPYLLTERPELPNAYRQTYFALAQEEFPDNHHGSRAERDEYLELYGIMPTLTVLRQRMRARAALDCAADVDLSALESFDGFIAYRDNRRARRNARRFNRLETQVNAMVERESVVDASELRGLSDADAVVLREYNSERARVEAIRAAQERLRCEGFFGNAEPTYGAMDWVTHEALARFERRHRVYGWGFIGRETIDLLRLPVMEVEREDVIRVLTERAMHAMRVIEDGSRSMVGDVRQTYRDADGEEHEVPDFETELRRRVIDAFGLHTPEDTLIWLESLGDLGDEDGHHAVAIDAPELPAYYSNNMALEFEIDRGDVWYEFPFDAEGRERSQPVARRPRLTVYVNYEDQRIALARFGTTIGGWRSESVDGTIMWKYKGSEVGPRVIQRIVAAPVWLPPQSTPDRALLNRVGRNPERFALNYHETGPSYASAYGLVAAYHQKYRVGAQGEIQVGGDEGIRTHGSVDYMSIMRRHSHGCHRLHNHIAVRLMSFVLTRRPHRRVGQQRLSFRRNVEWEGHAFQMAIDEGGYEYRLEEPLHVNVLEGRIRGQLRRPVEHPIPRYNSELGAYIQPDGQYVSVDRNGVMTPIETPDAGPDAGDAGDAGVPDAGTAQRAETAAGQNSETVETGSSEAPPAEPAPAPPEPTEESEASE